MTNASTEFHQGPNEIYEISCNFTEKNYFTKKHAKTSRNTKSDLYCNALSSKNYRYLS